MLICQLQTIDIRYIFITAGMHVLCGNNKWKVTSPSAEKARCSYRLSKEYLEIQVRYPDL